MKEEQDYIKDIAEIRSMMEGSSKFLSLSGWAGIFAGFYALTGVLIAYHFYDFNPNEVFYNSIEQSNFFYVVILALIVLVFSLVTAIYFSRKNASTKGEKVWNATSKRLLRSMAVPLVVGGILILILISKELIGLIAPVSLIFYGLSLYNASKFTIDEVMFLGFIQIGLGFVSSYFIEFSILFWALGFGVAHIVYGIYMYFRYER